MKRWVWFLVCAILGLVSLVCGLLVPAHLRAVDASVIRQAGRNTPTLLELGRALVSDNNLGAAQLISDAAEQEKLPDRDNLNLAIGNLAARNPELQTWGGGESRWQNLFDSSVGLTNSGSVPLTDFVVRLENRNRVLAYLQHSPLPAVQELLRTRELTNTVVFSPSASASGQAFDAAVSVCGLLMDGSHLSAGLSNEVFAAALQANRTGNSEPLEQVLLNVMSLGQRFNCGQLIAFVKRIQTAETLRLMANLVRHADSQLPILFSAVQLSGQPREVAGYLMNFSQSGLTDLGSSLRYGAGGLNEILQRNRRLHASGFNQELQSFAPFGAFESFASAFALRLPWWALTAKWLLYLAGGFLLALSLHFARPAVSALERPLQVRGFHLAREFLFAIGFLLVVLLLSEPFLSQENQKVEFPFRLHLPTMGVAVPAGNPSVPTTVMSQPSLLIILLFFVLQALLYTACLVKLAEIRRQQVMPRVKLKLLENEDHLFDAGLYLGFLGTIISLVLSSIGVFQQVNLMVAYSSTSFGIIFVSFFKICHLRPARRKLLLEVDAHTSTEETVPPAAAALASPV